MQKLLDVVPEGKVADEALEPETTTTALLLAAGGAVVGMGAAGFEPATSTVLRGSKEGGADAGEVDGGEGDAEPPLALARRQPPSPELVALDALARMLALVERAFAPAPEPAIDVAPVGAHGEAADCARCMDYGLLCQGGSAAWCPHPDAQHDYCACTAGLIARAEDLPDERCDECLEGQHTGDPCLVHAHALRCRCVECATSAAKEVR